MLTVHSLTRQEAEFMCEVLNEIAKAKLKEAREAFRTFDLMIR